MRNSEFRPTDVESFIREVCKWGNYAGIAGRILAKNDINLICEIFAAASVRASNGTDFVDGALELVNRINGLGKPSFASKHLRFLWPEFCPVFDSILEDALKFYDPFPRAYRQFAEDCESTAKAL